MGTWSLHEVEGVCLDQQDQPAHHTPDRCHQTWRDRLQFCEAGREYQ